MSFFGAAPIAAIVGFADLFKSGIRFVTSNLLRRLWWIAFIVLGVKLISSFFLVYFLTPQNMISIIENIISYAGSDFDFSICGKLPEQVCPLLDRAGVFDLINRTFQGCAGVLCAIWIFNSARALVGADLISKGALL